MDGKKLCYRIVKGAPSHLMFTRESGEVWVGEVDSGRTEPVAPGFQALNYDISGESNQVVMEAEDAEGKPRLWLASVERQSPPRQIPNVQGRRPKFGPTGEIFFQNSGSVYRVRQDGTGMRKALERNVLMMKGVSPDGRWILAWAPLAGGGTAVQAFPLQGGGSPVAIFGHGNAVWAPGGGSFVIAGGVNGFISEGRSYRIPLAFGQALPRIPAGGFHSEREVAGLPGVRRIEEMGMVPGPSPDIYAFYRSTTQRNFYRIPLR